VLADPIADVIWESLVKLLEVLWNNKAIASDVSAIADCERIALFNRKIGEIKGSISRFRGIALHGELSFERNLNNMRASLEGRDELATTVQRALTLPTRKEAEHIINVVIGSLETMLLNNLGTDGFMLKLNGFGKFSVRHKPGVLKRVGYSGETVQTKMKRKIRFVSLGVLRQRERVE
jgi:nucleoid DNA-binding protein